MAVLGRLKIAPNQRLDLPDIEAFDSYSAGDWSNYLLGMTGGNPYILKGFQVLEPNGLIGNPATTVSVIVSDSMLWWPQGTEGSFFSALPSADNVAVSLITASTNYVEMTLTLKSGAQDARALWDPGANGGVGGEFTQVVDTEYYLDVEITRNNTGFSTDKIPLCTVTVDNNNNVVAVTDGRPLLFRLGSGGATPDPMNQYSWSNTPNGYSRQDTPVTMTSSLDPNVFEGADKNITSMKEWMDAVMTRVKEVDGGAKWFAPSANGTLSLTNLFLDSDAGHSPIPSKQVTFTWSKNNDGQFRSENAVAATVAAGWRANFGTLKWYLGGTFTSATNRAYSDYTFNVPVADGQHLYVALQRNAAINGDPSVTWQNVNGTTASALCGATGGFTGVAVGDYIKKYSGSDFQYYKVIQLMVNPTTQFTNGTVVGTVADATVQYVIIATHDGPILTSTEKYRYFRSFYETSDLVVSTYGFYNTDYYWLGARTGSNFQLRSYGTLEPGEEIEDLDDSDKSMQQGSQDLVLEKAPQTVYDPSSGYALKTGSGTLLTVRRRIPDNKVGNPSNSDNSGACLTYTIDAPVGLMTDGFGLWVRLDPSSGGSVSGGTVSDRTAQNTWQILDPIDNPLRDYDNTDVFLLARKFTYNGVAYLIFADGETYDFDGRWVNDNLSVQYDLFLKEKHQWSVPFIGTTGGRVDENNAEFFWNNVSGNDSLGVLGVRNLRITQDTTNNRDVIDQDVAQDHYFLPNLGQFTIRLGSSTSTVRIPGDLLVDGKTTSVNTTNLQVNDKLISLGVGNALDDGEGSGVEVADNTLSAASISSTSGQKYVNITFSSAHGYTTNTIVGVDADADVGGIESGEISGPYTVKVTGSVSGDAQVISSTVLRVWTNVNATSTSTIAMSPPTTQVRTYTTPWSFFVSDSSGNGTGITSWAFKVKGQTTVPTLTPVSGYGIVPTANSSLMSAKRLPFAADDNVGPSGADTTFDFSPNLIWDNSTNVETVAGKILVTGSPTVSSNWQSFQSQPSYTGSGSYTYIHFDAPAMTVTGTAPTSTTSFHAGNTATGTSTNYAFVGEMNTGSPSNWNLYMSGTAPNYLQGVTAIGTSTLTYTDQGSTLHSPALNVYNPNDWTTAVFRSSSANGGDNFVLFANPSQTTQISSWSNSGMRVGVRAQGTGAGHVFLTSASDVVGVKLDATSRLGLGTAYNTDTTRTPASQLSVDGGATIGSGWSYSNAAPTDGLIVKGQVGLGTSSVASGTALQVDLANGGTDSDGTNSHIYLHNSNATGQTQITSVINGSTVGKWRSDFAGNISWVAYAGDHDFFTGGDSGTGTVKLAIKNNGNVAIGIATTAPLSKLDVGGNVAIGSYAGSVAAPSNGLIVSGDVGIGNSSPSAHLHIGSAVPGLTGGTTPGYVVGLDDTYATADGAMNALVNTGSFAQDKGGSIGFGGTYNGTSTVAMWSRVDGKKENTTSGDYSGYLSFSTRHVGGNLTEAMRVSSNQQVSIGNTNTNGLLNLGTNTTIASAGMYFGTDTDLYRSGTSTLKTDGAFVAGTLSWAGGTQGSVLFMGPTNTIAQHNSSFFWDDTNNRLGIGTAAPSYSLDVAGSTRLQQAQYVNYGSNVNGSYTVTDTDYLIAVNTAAVAGQVVVISLPGTSAGSGIATSNWYGQLFTPSSTFTVQSLSFWANWTVGGSYSAGTITLEAYVWTGSLGALVASGTINASSLTPVVGGFHEVNITMTTTGTVTSGTQYIWVYHASGVAGSANGTVCNASGTNGLFSSSGGAGWSGLGPVAWGYAVYEPGGVSTTTVSLPAVSSAQKGRVLVIKDVGGSANAGGAISITPNGVNKIDGSTSPLVINTSYGAVTLYCNGSDGWSVT